MKSLVIILLICSTSLGAKQTIRVLSWWDYISPKVIKKVESHGYKVDLSLYKSNEVAFSRIVSEGNKFDVLIISGGIVDSLSNLVPVKKITGNSGYKDYLPFLIKKDMKCVPYLWSATVFSVIGDEKVSTLEDLLNLKDKNYSIAVVDDPLEVMARAFLDLGCANIKDHYHYDWNQTSKCKEAQVKEYLKKLSPMDIKTSTAEYLVKNKTAAYGWHGELNPLLDTPNFNINIPKNKPIIGADYVCMVGKGQTDKTVMKFINLLTDHDSTELNMKSLGYFSPYVNHTNGLHKKMKTLYSDIIAKSKNEGVVLINSPPPQVYKSINNLWQKIRYEKK